MEEKSIFYIVVAIGYVLYSLYQKGTKEQEKQSAQKQSPKPVSPPARSVFEQALEEIKQQKEITKPKPEPIRPAAKQQPKDIFVKQKVNPAFEEGKTAYNLYEREATKEEQRIDADIKERADSFQKAFAMDEAEESKFEFDARQAFISSLIFERKS
jgi:hypothetical protein